MAAHLVADIGGTNGRFALAGSGESPVVLPVADYGAALDMIRDGLCHLGNPSIGAISVAAAGPVDKTSVTLTNGSLVFRADEIGAAFGGVPVRVFNDVQAAALALPGLVPGDLLCIGPEREPDFGHPVALANVGTGLGVSCLVPGVADSIPALATEGGHASLAAVNAVERQILAAMETRFGHVSAERVLSGKGLANLHHAMTGQDWAPGEIVRSALSGESDAVATLTQFTAFLGTFAGNLALIYGAWGGIFIGGGVPPRFANFLAMSPFRTRFKAKGRFRQRLEQVPTYLVLKDDIALEGLASLRL
ncbi:MAG: glucokinase [Alphaproteobacteria bacterium]